MQLVISNFFEQAVRSRFSFLLSTDAKALGSPLKPFPLCREVTLLGPD